MGGRWRASKTVQKCLCPTLKWKTALSKIKQQTENYKEISNTVAVTLLDGYRSAILLLGPKAFLLVHISVRAQYSAWTTHD